MARALPYLVTHILTHPLTHLRGITGDDSSKKMWDGTRRMWGSKNGQSWCLSEPKKQRRSEGVPSVRVTVKVTVKVAVKVAVKVTVKVRDGIGREIFEP